MNTTRAKEANSTSPNSAELAEHNGERVEEDDLDVEDDEDHRHQVKAHREAGRRLSVGGDPGLVGPRLAGSSLAVGPSMLRP